jgi:AraC-like DNA-binding protein
MQTIAITSVAEALVSKGDPDATHEAALTMAAAALARTHGTLAVGRKSSFSDERRISLAVKYIETHFELPCTLKALAADAGMSA